MFEDYFVRVRQQDTHFQTGKLKGTREQLKNAHTFLNENFILKPAIFFKLVSVSAVDSLC